MKILLLEDDTNIAFVIQRYFENAGYSVQCAHTLAQTKNLVLEDYDLAILDINLPDGNGFEYLHYLRSFSSIPILILTVKDGEQEVLTGFREGADDYITKPFSLAILKARVENVLKHSREIPGSTEKLIEYGELTLFLETKTCQLNSRDLNLGPIEFDLLVLLLQKRGLFLSRDQIKHHLWEKKGIEIQDNTMSVTVKRLREKLGSYASCIHTARGIGYRWEDKQ